MDKKVIKGGVTVGVVVGLIVLCATVGTTLVAAAVLLPRYFVGDALLSLAAGVGFMVWYFGDHS